MQKYLEKENEISFDKLFNQILGYLLFKDFCESMSDEPVPQLKFYEEVRMFDDMIITLLGCILDSHPLPLAYLQTIHDTTHYPVQ